MTIKPYKVNIILYKLNNIKNNFIFIKTLYIQFIYCFNKYELNSKIVVTGKFYGIIVTSYGLIGTNTV